MKIAKIILLTLVFSITGWSDTLASLKARAVNAAEVLQESVSIPDNSIPLSLLSNAECIGTFPNVIRVGFVFGGRYGKGLISCRVGTGWSSPSYFTIVGGSWGLQIGANSTDLILVFMNRDAIQKITKSKLTLGAGASVAAGPMGRDAAIGTDFTLESEIYAYSRSRGLYAGITLDGSVLSADTTSNSLLYGKSVKTVSILEAREKSTPSAAWPYVEALMAYAM